MNHVGCPGCTKDAEVLKEWRVGWKRAERLQRAFWKSQKNMHICDMLIQIQTEASEEVRSKKRDLVGLTG